MNERSEGEKLAAEGAERAYAAADQNWKDLAYKAVYEVCLSHADFTADEVWELLKKWGVPPCKEGRAMSGVLGRAERAGWCELTEGLRKSKRTNCHANLISVRRSLIYLMPRHDIRGAAA